LECKSTLRLFPKERANVAVLFSHLGQVVRAAGAGWRRRQTLEWGSDTYFWISLPGALEGHEYPGQDDQQQAPQIGQLW
jgi:hypothetical protein